MVNLEIERQLWERGVRCIAGIDEAGRGPLAGPVVAAAVVFPDGTWIDGVDDSKKLSASQRERLHDLILQKAISVGTGTISNEMIDEINILQATMEAMKEAVSRLSPMPGHLLIDGPYYRDEKIPFTTVVGGDARCFSIAAASIIAKVTRDRLMVEYDRKFPQYGFARHKGYGTREHREAIRRYGPCEIHRRSFRLVDLVLSGDNG